MIIITLSHNHHEIRYRGKIDIIFDGEMYLISAYIDFKSYDILVHDLYFKYDIDSIRGIDETDNSAQRDDNPEESRSKNRLYSCD